MNVVIVEDHLMFREVLRKLCEVDLAWQVSGETSSGAAGLTLVQDTRPSLLVLDLQLADLDGFQLLAKLQGAGASPRTIIISAYCDRYTVYRAEHLNIQGFVDKRDASLFELKTALSTVGNGGVYFSQRYTAERAAQISDPSSIQKLLSQVEQTVLSHIGKGLTDEEIGVHLAISPHTAKRHRSNILHKLGKPSTPKLMAYASENGFTRFGT